jgi:hypothetical protein
MDGWPTEQMPCTTMLDCVALCYFLCYFPVQKLAGGPPVMGANGPPAAIGFVAPQGPPQAQPQQPQYGGYQTPSAPTYQQPQQSGYPQQQTMQTVQVAPNGTNAVVQGVSNAAYNSMQVQLPSEISRSVNDSMHLVNRHMSTFQVVTGAPWQFICDYGGIFNMLDMSQRQSWGGNFGNMINDTHVSTAFENRSKVCLIRIFRPVQLSFHAE